MSKNRFSSAIFLSGILLSILGASVDIQAGERIPIPDGVYYHRFISSVDGPEAIWVNPALLGKYKTVTINYIAEIYESKLSENWGINITGDGIGIGYRRLDDFMGKRYDEYLFASGIQLGTIFYGGTSYRYIKNGADLYNRRHFWNIGLFFGTGTKFNYAAVFSNLNRGRVDGERTDVEQVYAISYQPSGEIILSAELSLSTGQNLSQAKYNYGLEILPYQGVTVYANMYSGDGFEIGVRINVLKYFIGGQSRYGKDNDHAGTSLFGGYVFGRQDSIIEK